MHLNNIRHNFLVQIKFEDETSVVVSQTKCDKVGPKGDKRIGLIDDKEMGNFCTFPDLSTFNFMIKIPGCACVAAFNINT